MEAPAALRGDDGGRGRLRRGGEGVVVGGGGDRGPRGGVSPRATGRDCCCCDGRTDSRMRRRG